MKIKYLIDKAMVGKLPPLNLDGKPMVLPNLHMRKIKSENVKFGNLNGEITLRKMNSEAVHKQ